MKRLTAIGLILMLALPLLSGCNSAYAKFDKAPALSLVEPMNQDCLDNILPARYSFAGKNESNQEQIIEFEYPLCVAIGGRISNETGSYEQAPPGQTTFTRTLGEGTRKYFAWTASRMKAIRALLRDPFDRDEMKKEFLEIGGTLNVINGEPKHLPSLTSSISTQMAEQEVWGKGLLPDVFITGALTEVTVAEKSYAVGATFAGMGPSGKRVQTSVSASLEITDMITGEMLVSVMGQNRVSAYQVGFDLFRIASAFGTKDEFLNAQLSIAKEVIKQQVQVELVDYLFAEAFKKLQKEQPNYLTQRLNFRVEKIQQEAERIAKEKGLTIIGEVAPVQ